jgi:anthranilate synthase/aminodeoxychorismate synthase-like glutamine amidotransferase
MLLIIDNYDSFTYNLVQAFGSFGARMKVYRNDEVSVDEVQALKPAKLVISPGPGVPARAGITLDAIRRFSGKIPILGVCLGHQAIAEAFGGEVIGAQRLMHGKVSAVYHDGQGCYRGVRQPFEATRYHSLIVNGTNLPDCFKVTSLTKQGEIMGIRHKEFAIEGVQFHPESFLTQDGVKLLRNFLRQ